MSLDTYSVPELSGQQRRCHLLLMLYTPLPAVQLETISQTNGVDLPTTRQDIAEVASEIQRFHHLELCSNPNGHYQIVGSELNQRLCLIHWLRRALRCSPQFIEQHFTPNLLQGLGLTSDTLMQLEQCINHCEQQLQQNLEPRDHQFLQHFLCYCLWENRRQRHPDFEQNQSDWLHQKTQHSAAIVLHQALHKQFGYSLTEVESDFLVLMFTMMKNHSYQSDDSAEDRRLMQAIEQMVARFQQISGMTFSDNQELITHLFAHLAPALERCQFDIGIDNSLLEEVLRKYPRLMHTTQQAMEPFEQDYAIRFSREEVGLVAISFGAWLMQDYPLLIEQAPEPLLREIIQELLETSSAPYPPLADG